jgi:uncharacterized protein YndB with AHSA1/START domain
MTTSDTDKIEKQFVLKAAPARVWRAITDSEEFGRWFGVALEPREFTPGAQVVGRITTPGYDHLRFEMTVEAVEPERRVTWRWHPYAVDPAVDYSREPTTLVEFELMPVSGGTQVRIVESGFDALPASRRQEAFRMNTGGWQQQAENLERHVQASR